MSFRHLAVTAIFFVIFGSAMLTHVYSASPTPAPGVIVTEAIFVTGAQLEGRDRYDLGGFVLAPDDRPFVSIVWRKDASSLFAVWRLELIAHETQPSSARTSADASGRVLVSVVAAPTEGHVYSVALSLHRDARLFAASVYDKERKAYVLRESVPLQLPEREHASTRSPSPWIPAAADHLELVSLRDAYVPLDLEWGLLSGEDKGGDAVWSRTSRISRLDPVKLACDMSERLAPGDLSGNLRLIARNAVLNPDAQSTGEEGITLFEGSIHECLDTVAPVIDAFSLSAGAWQLELDYEFGGRSWNVGVQTIPVVEGVVYVAIQDVQRVAPLTGSDSIRGTFSMWTDGRTMPAFDVELTVSFTADDVQPNTVQLSLGAHDVGPEPVRSVFTLSGIPRDESRLSFVIADEQVSGWQVVGVNVRDHTLPAVGFVESVVFRSAASFRPTYRNPAIVQAPNGDLLAFAEKRHHGTADVGHIHLVMKRSTDGGMSWSDEAVVFAEGVFSHADPTPFVDAVTGKTLLFFLWDKRDIHVMVSEDSGYTWSQARSIHRETTKQIWVSGYGWGVGPGSGVVQLRHGPYAGRIVVPARHRDPAYPLDHSHRPPPVTHVFFSDDHGETWQVGGNAIQYASENQLVELENGDLLMSARDQGLDKPSPDSFENIRHLMAVSSDGGVTWSPASRWENVISPEIHASIDRLTTEREHDRSRLVFVNPKRLRYRQNLTVRLSYDEGATWSEGRTIYDGPSSYSDIVVLDDLSTGVLYERGQRHWWEEIVFARFTLGWMSFDEDEIAVPEAGGAR